MTADQPLGVTVRKYTRLTEAQVRKALKGPVEDKELQPPENKGRRAFHTANTEPNYVTPTRTDHAEKKSPRKRSKAKAK